MFEILKSLVESRIAKNASWLLIHNLSRLFISLLVGVVVARYLGPTDYGLLTLSLSIATAFSVLSTLGVDRVIVRDLSQETETVELVLGTAIGLRILGGLLGIILSVIAATAFNASVDAIHLVALVSLFSTGFLIHSVRSLQVWFQVKLESKYAVAPLVFGLVLSAIYRLVLVYFEMPLLYFAYSAILDACVAAILLALITNTKLGIDLPIQISRGYAKQLLYNSYPLALSALAGVLYVHVDKLMLGASVGLAAVGVYAAYTFLTRIPLMVCSAVSLSVAPKLMKIYAASEADCLKTIRRYLGLNAWFTLVCASILIWIGDAAVGLVFGLEYQYDGLLIVILAFTCVLQGPTGLRPDFAILKEATRILLFYRLASLLLNICLNFVLIPLWGIVGAALATLITVLFHDCILSFFTSATRPYGKIYMLALLDAIIQRPLLEILKGTFVKR